MRIQSIPKDGPEEHGIPPCMTKMDWFTQCETGSHSNTLWNRWNIFASYLANTYNLEVRLYYSYIHSNVHYFIIYSVNRQLTRHRGPKPTSVSMYNAHLSDKFIDLQIYVSNITPESFIFNEFCLFAFNKNPCIIIIMF